MSTNYIHVFCLTDNGIVYCLFKTKYNRQTDRPTTESLGRREISLPITGNNQVIHRHTPSHTSLKLCNGIMANTKLEELLHNDKIFLS